ncbi:hypothetical protein TWF281_002059 [Arthrobotrys megalospora]
MPPMNLLIGGLGFTHASNFTSGLNDFISDRNVVWDFVRNHWTDFTEWIAQPHIYVIILTWAITFTVVTTFLLSLGFGPAGIIGGSLAAAFQGWMYGGFTPAAGIFATLTSLGMLGMLVPAVVAVSATVATVVSVIVWVTQK